MPRGRRSGCLVEGGGHKERVPEHGEFGSGGIPNSNPQNPSATDPKARPTPAQATAPYHLDWVHCFMEPSEPHSAAPAPRPFEIN